MKLSKSQLRLLSDYSTDISKALLVSLLIQIALDKNISNIQKAAFTVTVVLLAGFFLFFALKWRKKL
jgi:hypothetical protein